MVKDVSFDPDTLEGAIGAGSAGKQSAWIQAHLKLPYNKNSDLAEGLLSVPTRSYLGPIKIPLEDLLRVCGPEATMEFPEEEAVWERRMHFLTDRLETGWSPPPFIVAGSLKKPFYLADGNHRLVAMERVGIKEYWAIFYFDDATAKQEFINLFLFDRSDMAYAALVSSKSTK